MIYADTSFLFALYQSGDNFHGKAFRLTARLQQPFAFTLLGELELLTNVYRSLAGGVINRQQHDAVLRQISEDSVEGILVRQAVNETDLYSIAGKIGRKYIPEIPLRSLDILHVAAAQILRVSHFATFDKRQHTLALRFGLSTLPSTL